MHPQNAATEYITRLAATLRQWPLREKLLLAPSYRVGRQWLDAAALYSGGVANVRVVTRTRLILDYAEPGLRRRNRRPAGTEEKIRMVGVALETLTRDHPDSGYFTRLPPSLELTRTLLLSLEELEDAGIESITPLARHLGSREKADELARLYRSFRLAKADAGVVGLAGIVDAALEGLQEEENLPLLIVPESLADDAGTAERRFLDAWPETNLARLPEDAGPCLAAVSCRVADSVANEARLVFRTIQERSLPLDAVEIVCLDQGSYVPALCAAGLEMFSGRVEELPFTFHGGLPAVYSRPSRLIAAWIEWLELDLPPVGLAGMLQSGLMGQGWREDAPQVGGAELAARILELPIYGGPEEYRRALGADKSAPEMTLAENWLARRLLDVIPLANGGAAVDRTTASQVLSAALKLLEFDRAGENKFDAYARVALRETIAAWLPHTDWPGFKPLTWLAGVNAELRVMGLGPMPGRLHVADLRAGGHTGRACTFVMGLDDRCFPGGVRQDPVLLDKERRGMSRRLPVGDRRREQREAALARLLARVRGEVCLSYSRHDADAEREQYPATLFNRFAESSPQERAETLLAPFSAAECLCRRDDWLRVLLASRRNTLTPAALEPWQSWLSRGWTARRQRESSVFTEYDGKVPEAGDDYRKDPWLVSPTDLETLAANPQEYFFKRVLGLTPPDRFEAQPGRWLAGNERGNLLHDLFQDFAKELIDSDDAVNADNLSRHRERLLELLEKSLYRYRRDKPVRDRLAYERERQEMLEACVIFLQFETDRYAEGRPICLEAALGGAKLDEPPWNRAEPVTLPLPGGGTLPLKGRVDRIDRLHNHGGLSIWDYKTGRSDKFSRDDPFNQGRHLQPLLYAMMLDWVTGQVGTPEPVRSFSYFFPMPRDEGRVFTYSWQQLLRGGMDIVGLLTDMLAAGTYPFSPQLKDCAYSDYERVWGNISSLAAAAKNKMENDPNLSTWARLRGAEE